MSKYYWTPTSDMGIDDFVKKYRPSMVEQQNSPWLWVSLHPDGYDPEDTSDKVAAAVDKAEAVVKGLVKRMEEIEADDAIPTRAKKGVKSKKVVREEAQADAAATLKKLSLESGYTNGKWLFFPRQENVDRMWSLIARSVAGGPLREAGVTIAKVATSKPEGGDEQLHAVIVYVSNLYDKELATKILVSLLKDHGLEPSACKTDLYTILGLDSSHPAKLKASVWKVSELVDGGVEGVKALKAQFKPGSEKNWKAPEEAAKGEPAAKGEQPADKAPLPTAVEVDDTQPADEEKESKKSVSFSEEPKKRANPVTPSDSGPAKRPKSAAVSYKENDMFAGSDGDSDSD